MRKIGFIGFGAFGQFMAKHLAPYFRLEAYDPIWTARDTLSPRLAVESVSLERAASAPVVIFATPVQKIEAAAVAAAPFIQADALVLDVGSVKQFPLAILERIIPAHADLIGTHPLFGPQSGANGIFGKQIIVCPIRSRRTRTVKRFLEHELKLDVSVISPDQHDSDIAMVQGLTHLIAKVIRGMGPMPESCRTDSFQLFIDSASLLRNDSDELFLAIEQLNPYAREVTRRFFERGEELREILYGARGNSEH